jgi:hypothetical protein
MIMPAGRPSVYKDDIPQRMLEYFDIEATKTVIEKMFDKNGKLSGEKEREVANTLPTIEGFCRLIGVSKETLHRWLDDEEKEELRDAYKKSKSIQEAIWLECSLKGLYHPLFTIFMGKNVFGWSDKVEVKADVNTTQTLQAVDIDRILAEAEERSKGQK